MTDGIEPTYYSFTETRFEPRSMLKGLLVRASLELGERLATHPALRVSSDGQSLRLSSGVVSPASLRPVGTGFTGPTAPDINNAKSRFSCWLLRAGTVRVRLVQEE